MTLLVRLVILRASALQVRCFVPQLAIGLIQKNLERQDEHAYDSALLSKCATVCWFMWNARNRFLFSNDPIIPAKIVEYAFDFF